LLGFLLAPTGTPIADLAAVSQQHRQGAGRLLGPALLRGHLIAALHLLVGTRCTSACKVESSMLCAQGLATCAASSYEPVAVTVKQSFSA
jgi:hypothetical protein